MTDSITSSEDVAKLFNGGIVRGVSERLDTAHSLIIWYSWFDSEALSSSI